MGSSPTGNIGFSLCTRPNSSSTCDFRAHGTHAWHKRHMIPFLFDPACSQTRATRACQCQRGHACVPAGPRVRASGLTRASQRAHACVPARPRMRASGATRAFHWGHASGPTRACQRANARVPARHACGTRVRASEHTSACQRAHASAHPPRSLNPPARSIAPTQFFSGLGRRQRPPSQGPSVRPHALRHSPSRRGGPEGPMAQTASCLHGYARPSVAPATSWRGAPSHQEHPLRDSNPQSSD